MTQAGKLVQAFPVTRVTAERSIVLFSSSHKDRPEELNDAAAPKQLDLAVCSELHTVRTDTLDLSSVVKAFVSANIRRSNYFRKF